jgi:hypothetical protein
VDIQAVLTGETLQTGLANPLDEAIVAAGATHFQSALHLEMERRRRLFTGEFKSNLKEVHNA